MGTLFGIAESGLGSAGAFVRRRASDGAYWSTSGTPAYEAYAAGHIANYAIAATETGAGTGQYTAADPDSAATEGDYLLVKMSGSGGAVLAQADLAAARWQDRVRASSITVGGYASGQDPATLVLDPVASGHNTAGTIGAKINTAGSNADPFTNPVPGSYAAGTAGQKLGAILAGTISASTPAVDLSGNFTIVQGDDYLAAQSRAILFNYSAIDLTGFTITLVIQNPPSPGYVSITGSVLNAGLTNQQLQFELPAATTTLLQQGPRSYQIHGVSASNKKFPTILGGTATIVARIGA